MLALSILGLAPLRILASTVTAVPSAIAPNPGILEVDLIFPRKDTYAPVSLMPVVFAVQNPVLASTLVLSLTWSISWYPSPNASFGPEPPGSFPHDSIDLYNLNASPGDLPYFSTSYTPLLQGLEGDWLFEYHISSRNCSGFAHGWLLTNFQGDSLIFTTRNSSKIPDLVAASSAANCAMGKGEAWNVTALEDVSERSDYLDPHQSSCAVLGPSPTARNPCAATIDSAAASSISAAITASATGTTSQITAMPTQTPVKSQTSQRLDPAALRSLMPFGIMLLWAC